MILPRYALFASVLAAAGLPIYIHAPKVYVDDYDIGLAEIGFVLLALRLIDVVQDPFLGRLAGILGEKARINAALLAGFGMALGMLGLFYVTPPIAPIWWMAICLALLFSCFSFLTILFYARGVAQGTSMGPRGHLRLAGWRETGALLGVSLATMAPFVLGTAEAPGYGAFALIFAVLVLVASFLMRPVWPGPMVRMSGGFANLLQDTGIRRLLLIAVVNSAPVAMTSTLFLFFVEYRLGAPEMAGPLLLGFFLAAALAAPIWSKLAARSSEVAMIATGMGLSMLAFIWAYTLGTGDVVAFAVICLLSGAALGADMTLLPALYARRIAEVGAVESDAFGLWNFASKLTLALAAAFVLPLLEWSGFRAGATNDANALHQLSLLYALVPTVLKALALGLLFTRQNAKVLA